MIFSPHHSAAIAANIRPAAAAPAIHHILVPVDFSACADNAIRFAVAVALRSGAKIKLFHSVHIPMQTSGIIVDSMEALEREAQKGLNETAAEIEHWLDREKFPPVEIQTYVRTGFPAEEIVAAADQDNSELIIMGTHGAGAIEGFLLGSNTATVIKNAKCPVLMVPEVTDYIGFSKLAYATDLQVIDTDTISRLAKFAEIYDAELEIVHVIPPGEELNQSQNKAFRAKVKELCTYPKLQFTNYESIHTTIPAALEHYIEEEKIPLLALLARERGFFANIFHSSVTRKLTIDAKIPLLVFHE